MILYVGIVIGTPVIIVVAAVFGCIYLGWSAIIGIITFLSYVPLQVSICITQKSQLKKSRL